MCVKQTADYPADNVTKMCYISLKTTESQRILCSSKMNVQIDYKVLRLICFD